MVVPQKDETKDMLARNLLLLLLTLAGAYTYGIFLIGVFIMGLLAFSSALVFFGIFGYFGMFENFSMSFSSSSPEDVSNALLFMNFVAIAVGFAGKLISRFITKRHYGLKEKAALLAKLLAVLGAVSLLSIGLHATLNQGISNGIFASVAVALLYAALALSVLIPFVAAEFIYALRDKIIEQEKS